MIIRIICLGKIKDNNLKSLINDYIKKISYYNEIKIIELNDITFKNENENQIKLILSKEQELIKPFLNDSYNIVLSIQDEMIDSIEMSKTIENIFNYQTNYKFLNFIIGSSYGLSDNIKQSANLKWSFGKITLNHQIMRLVLLEQIYRAFTIINNIKYHK